MKNSIPTVDVTSISFSAVSLYLKCGKQYYFRYVEGRKDVPGIALLEGSSHHKAVEENNIHKKKKGWDLKAPILTETFVEELRSRVKAEERVDWGNEKESGLIKRAKVWHADYIKKYAPKIMPVMIEEKFEVPVEVEGVKFAIKGVIDLGLKSKVLDYKTLARAKSQYDTNQDLQLSLYAFAAKKRKVGFIQFLKSANPEVGIVEAERTSMQIQWALKVAKEVVQSIKAGAFPMTQPTNWWCSSRFCGYWKLCRGKYERY